MARMNTSIHPAHVSDALGLRKARKGSGPGPFPAVDLRQREDRSQGHRASDSLNDPLNESRKGSGTKSFRTFGECFEALGWSQERILAFHLRNETLCDALLAISHELAAAGLINGPDPEPPAKAANLGPDEIVRPWIAAMRQAVEDATTPIRLDLVLREEAA